MIMMIYIWVGFVLKNLLFLSYVKIIMEILSNFTL